MSETRITPPNRNRRLLWVGIIGLLLASGLYLIFQVLNQSVQFFENASDVVAEGFEPRSETYKVGGVVAPGSIVTEGVVTKFRIEDFERDMVKELRVTYSGALPDLFREGEGVVVTGSLTSPTHFQATKLLAKHDENYQPKINYRDKVLPD